MIEEGTEAPDFELTSDDGSTVRLSDLRGKPVVLYFYPKDDTPGCTTQACGIRDAWGDFERAGAVVLGVSPDDEQSHVKFKAKYDLPFTLLADTDHKTADEYGVWGEKTYAGKTYDGRLPLHVRDRRRRQRRQGATRREAGHPRRRRAGGALPVAVALPPPLAEAIERVVARAGGSVEQEVERLSAAYRGQDAASVRAASTRAGVAAYLAYRAPATYAATASVFRQVALGRPGWTPRSLLDVGAGPGVAAWAALATWPSLVDLTLVEAEPEMVAAGRELLPGGRWVQADASDAREPADLVVASYVLGELPSVAVVTRLWATATDAIAFVEPGTPAGYRRILEARSAVIAAGGFTVAPCPHDETCPLPSDDWCHFGVRLPRSKLHRRAKGVELGYEDEKFAYAVLSRLPATGAAARLIRRPQNRSGHVNLVTCEPDGIHARTVSRKQGALYKDARGAAWGDAIDLRERQP